MAPRRSGSGGTRGGGGRGSSSCQLGTSATAVIACSVIFSIVELAIIGFCWWKKKKSAAAPVRPLRYYNFLLAIVVFIFSHILDIAQAAVISCEPDENGQAIGAAAQWFYYIACLILLWTILIPVCGAFWTISGGSFKFIKFSYWAVLGLLAVLALVAAAINSYVVNSSLTWSDVDLSLSGLRVRAAYLFIYFFTAISVSVLLVLSFLGMKKSSMAIGHLTYTLPAFIAFLFSWTLIPVIVTMTYSLGTAFYSESNSIAALVLSLIFECLVLLFLLLIGTSAALNNDPAPYNPVINPGNGTPNHEPKPDGGSTYVAAPQPHNSGAPTQGYPLQAHSPSPVSTMGQQHPPAQYPQGQYPPGQQTYPPPQQQYGYQTQDTSYQNTGYQTTELGTGYPTSELGSSTPQPVRVVPAHQ